MIYLKINDKEKQNYDESHELRYALHPRMQSQPRKVIRRQV